MPEPRPQTGPRHEPERIYERGADPAEAANRPLEPKGAREPLAEADEPGDGPRGPRPDPPHHALNTPVGEPDPTADSDPYMQPAPGDDSDTAGSTSGVGEGAEGR